MMELILLFFGFLLELAAGLPAASVNSGLVQREDPLNSYNISASVRTTLNICNNRPGPPRGSKKGVAYEQGNTPWANKFQHASWAYNWFSNEHYYSQSPDLKREQEFVPMMWGLKHDLIRDWKPNVEKQLAKNSKHLLAFNEPDHPGESNMSPQNAVNAYREYMQEFNCRARLGAPAVTSTQNDQNKGLGWLTQFLRACTGCIIDFIPIHIYVYAPHPDPVGFFKQQVERAEQAGASNQRTHARLPIWVTEFQFVGFGQDREVQHMRDVVSWMNARPGVERYSYFKADKNNLINGAGNELSYLGGVYDNA
jgi:Glycosyl hydrolase catalytic core